MPPLMKGNMDHLGHEGTSQVLVFPVINTKTVANQTA